MTAFYKVLKRYDGGHLASIIVPQTYYIRRLKCLHMFTYYLIGEGATEQEALENALEAFVVDPGEPAEVEPYDDNIIGEY